MFEHLRLQFAFIILAKLALISIWRRDYLFTLTSENTFSSNGIQSGQLYNFTRFILLIIFLERSRECENEHIKSTWNLINVLVLIRFMWNQILCKTQFQSITMEKQENAPKTLNISEITFRQRLNVNDSLEVKELLGSIIA